jgi:hypothetical protein
MEGRGFGMIARSFKSVIWVATVGGAALCCYMVSLRVATERADLAKVERQIFAAKREIRLLQTELGTRGRMTQLEDWNANVLALSAPSSAQFVKDDVTLARLERRDATVADRSAEIRMASAETGAATPPAQPAAPAAEPPKPRIVQAIAHSAPTPAQPALHQASYTTASHSALAEEAKPQAPKPAPAKKPEPKPERHAKAATEKKPVSHAEASVEKKQLAHAKASKPEPDKKQLAHAKPAKPAPDKKQLAHAKPAKAAEKKQVAEARAPKPAAEKKLAHAKPVRHPAAAQESDAD